MPVFFGRSSSALRRASVATRSLNPRESKRLRSSTGSPDDAPGIFSKEFYVSIGERIEQHETRIPLNVNLVSSDEAAAADLDTEVSEEVVILRSARAQRDARGRAQAGDFEGAKSVLHEAAEELRSHAAGSPNADELRRMAADIEEDLPFLEDGEFDTSSAKRLHYKRNLTSQRRLQLQREEEERGNDQP